LAVNTMSADDTRRSLHRELLAASAMVAGGIVICGLALVQLSIPNPLMAQATPPLQSSPSRAPQDAPPAESKPGGERPTTPAPEPARPDAMAQKEGAKAALPPAPAEKIAPPIQQK
jgi:hypothetical protein